MLPSESESLRSPVRRGLAWRVEQLSREAVLEDLELWAPYL